MNINLSIDGFKKGNVYLQKIQDSALVNIDSVFVQNGDIIKLKHKISSPEIFYINLDISNSEKSKLDKIIITIEINTKVSNENFCFVLFFKNADLIAIMKSSLLEAIIINTQSA